MPCRAVEVTVQKRETERQQQARLNSYAYIAAKEEEEAWVDMAMHTEETRAAASIWDRFMKPKEVSGWVTWFHASACMPAVGLHPCNGQEKTAVVWFCCMP